jgi:hypothetical protein
MPSEAEAMNASGVIKAGGPQQVEFQIENKVWKQSSHFGFITR